LLLITDLSNRDKHPYPPRDGGHSLRSPKIVDITRVMQMTSGNEAGGVVFLPGRGLVNVGGSSAEVVVTGTIQDGAGNTIGDVHTVLQEAVTRLEQLLKDLGFSEEAA
jgi:enamine deaminase RidA (YjgF/YER057c/UK114 family)